MTVKELKAFLENVPDETEIKFEICDIICDWDWYGEGGFEMENDGIIDSAEHRTVAFPNEVVLHGRSSAYISSKELEKIWKGYENK